MELKSGTRALDSKAHIEDLFALNLIFSLLRHSGIQEFSGKRFINYPSILTTAIDYPLSLSSCYFSRFYHCFTVSLFSLLSVFEEPEDPTNRSFFSEIISSISDVKFSNSGRYMISRDYLSVKVWDLHMETKPIETYTVRINE